MSAASTTRDPYATHLPVLRQLAHALQIEHVLELGAGPYSTPEFLDRTAFPHLKMLVSVEPNSVWRDRVQQVVGSDRRLILTSMPIESVLLDLDCYDLIFIDNGDVEADRIPVIKAITAAKPDALVVIHDFEREAYRDAALGFTHCFVCNAVQPHTAVLSNGDRAAFRLLCKELAEANL